MKILIQSNHISDDLLNQIQQALADSPIKIPHAYVGVIPFSHEITSNEELVGTDYIPYGSTLFVKLAVSRQWKVNFNQDFNYRSALAHRSDMLNDTATVCTVDHALKTLDVIEFMGGQERSLFIRPSLDLKLFSGHVASSWAIRQFLLRALERDSSEVTGLKPETEVVLGDPVIIQQEVRLFIVDRKVVIGSVYRDKGRLKKSRLTDEQLARFQALVVDDKWLPDDCCVMDIAILPNQELKVIEFNCINCSGFYSASIDVGFAALLAYHTK